MPGAGTYAKALAAGAALCIGGPALVWYVTPSEEEIIKKYNPDLQKRALASRQQRQQEFDYFVSNLKEASKSDKPIWAAQEELAKKQNEERIQRLRDEQALLQADAERRRTDLRNSTQ